MAAKITRSRKEVLFSSEDHLTLPRNAVALRFLEFVSDHPGAMNPKAEVAWTTDFTAVVSHEFQPATLRRRHFRNAMGQRTNH